MTIRTPVAYVLRHRERVVRIAGWSVGVTLAPMFTGRAIVSAMDAASSGALAVSFMWLAGLLGAGAVGVLSLMRLSRLAADISADVQTDLTRDVVRHALGDAVAWDRVLRSGAELTQHVPVLVDVLSLGRRRVLAKGYHAVANSSQIGQRIRRRRPVPNGPILHDSGGALPNSKLSTKPG